MGSDIKGHKKVQNYKKEVQAYEASISLPGITPEQVEVIQCKVCSFDIFGQNLMFCFCL